MNTATSIKLIRTLSPDARESVLVARLHQFKAIVEKNGKDAAMAGKNKDYREGYNIGEYMKTLGGDYGPKDLDQEAEELLEGLEWHDLPVNNVEAFKDGIWNGYTLVPAEEDEDEE